MLLLLLLLLLLLFGGLLPVPKPLVAPRCRQIPVAVMPTPPRQPLAQPVPACAQVPPPPLWHAAPARASTRLLWNRSCCC